MSEASADLAELASRLRNAYDTGAIPPLRDVLEPTGVDRAYAVQALNTEYWKSQGREVVGFKVGLTAKAVQQQLGVDQPDFGVLFDDMQLPQGSELPMSRVIQPRAEAEVALILGERISSARVTAQDIASAVAYASPAIEIVDSRIADWQITFADTVADNGSSAMYVLGDAKLQVDALDLYSCGMVLEVDGEVVSVGAGAACLGHPFNAAAWLAEALVGRGQPLEAGSVILTGALGPMVGLQPRQTVRAVIGGLGEVSFRCSAD